MRMPLFKATIKSIVMLKCPHKNYTYAHLLLLSEPVVNSGGVILEDQQYMPVNVASSKLYLLKQINKGDLVTVTTHLNTRTFPGKDGHTRHRYLMQLANLNKA